MRITYSKSFTKQYKKLSTRLQQQTKTRIELWKEQPNHPLLNHHTLSGKLKGFHSINITGDIRTLYRVYDNTIYVYEMIGRHSQLYG